MTSKHFWRGVLIVALSVALAKPAEAKGYPSGGAIVAGVVGVVAAVVIVAVVVIHKSKERTITGCVTSGADGLSLKNEKDKKVYALSGDSAALKGGEQVALKGKKTKDSSGKPIFQVERLTKDYGACHP